MDQQSKPPTLETEAALEEAVKMPKASGDLQQELDFSGDDTEPTEAKPAQQERQSVHVSNNDVQQLEEVMNHGMQFLAGMFKMSTGKELGTEGQSIAVDKETGEVTMKFKLPI
jgi:hypothetical protein